jgi:hypothetical protein
MLDPRAVALWRAAKAPVAIGLVVIVAGVVLALFANRPVQGLLNPDAVDDAGSRALAELLRAEGVAVTVTQASADVGAAGADTTVLVASPQLLAPHQLQTVQRSGADLVLVDPGQEALAVLAPAATEAALYEPVDVREPGCSLPAASAAGPAELGGVLYRTTGGIGCYSDDGGAALVQVVERGRTVTVLGTPAPLTNGQLAQEGNAALAMRLLGAKPRVLWYLPAPEAAPTDQRRSLSELVPPGWAWGAVQLGFAAVVAALWRARRLGPVVREPLPVVVRAVEVVEGRGRLYQRAGAREHAADTLRAATRSRLTSLLGLAQAEGDVAPTALVEAVTARTERPPAEVHALLYGPAPADDQALVRLADELDTCERKVRHT